MNTYETIVSTTKFIDEKVCFRLYADNANEIFAHAPKAAGTNKDYAILPFRYGLQDYLYKLYPLFRQVVNTGALPDLFFPPNGVDSNDYYSKARKFIAMRMNGKALKRCRHGQVGLTLDRFRIPFFGHST